MDSDIKIYRNEWNDISSLKKFFHEHLLKYRVYEVNEELFSDPKKALPIVEIRDTILYNPTYSELREALGFTNFPKIQFHEFLILGNSTECGFVLDYALKHGMDARLLGNLTPRIISEMESMHNKILRIPNPYSSGFMEEFNPIGIEIMPNRMYIRVFSDTKSYFTRSLFIVFEGGDKMLKIPGDDGLIGEHIFFDLQDVIQKVKKKRVRNSRIRRFAISGDRSDILEEAFELASELEQYSDVMKYEILVFSSRNFIYANKHLLRDLRIRKNIKIYGKIKLREVKKRGFLIELKSDLLTYDVDSLLIYSRKELKNNFLKGILDLDDEGFLETDHTFKTKYPSIYSMRSLEKGKTPLTKVELLDKYMKCAEVVRRINDYLERN